MILLSGCGHAGMINAAEKLHDIDDKPVHMAVGGFHLFRAEDKTIEWTATKLDQFGLKKLVGAHCTGAHASATIAQLLGIPRSNISIGAIGTTIKQDLTIERTSIE